MDCPAPPALFTSSVASTDDAPWLRRARRGDPDAFTVLYQRHARAIHSLAWRLTGEPQIAEDILQETFMRLLRNIGGTDPERPLRPWLRTVATNLAIDHLRRGQRELTDETLEITAPSRQEPDRYLEASGLLRHLPPLARALVWLNQVEGWTHLSLGQKFGRSESWSKSIVARALTRLRTIAQASEASPDDE